MNRFALMLLLGFAGSLPAAKQGAPAAPPAGLQWQPALLPASAARPPGRRVPPGATDSAVRALGRLLRAYVAPPRPDFEAGPVAAAA